MRLYSNPASPYAPIFQYAPIFEQPLTPVTFPSQKSHISGTIWPTKMVHLSRCTQYFDAQLHGILPWANISRNGNIFFHKLSVYFPTPMKYRLHMRQFFICAFYWVWAYFPRNTVILQPKLMKSGRLSQPSKSFNTSSPGANLKKVHYEGR